MSETNVQDNLCHRCSAEIFLCLKTVSYYSIAVIFVGISCLSVRGSVKLSYSVYVFSCCQHTLWSSLTLRLSCTSNTQIKLQFYLRSLQINLFPELRYINLFVQRVFSRRPDKVRATSMFLHHEDLVLEVSRAGAIAIFTLPTFVHRDVESQNLTLKG